jgi:hypothetical protein
LKCDETINSKAVIDSAARITKASPISRAVK